MEAIRISCAGYPTKRPFYEFIDRFGILAPEVLNGRYYRCFISVIFSSPHHNQICWPFYLHWVYDSTDEVAVCKKLLEKVGLEGYQVMNQYSKIGFSSLVYIDFFFPRWISALVCYFLSYVRIAQSWLLVLIIHSLDEMEPVELYIRYTTMILAGRLHHFHRAAHKIKCGMSVLNYFSWFIIALIGIQLSTSWNRY